MVFVLIFITYLFTYSKRCKQNQRRGVLVSVKFGCFHRAGFHTSIVILWEKQSRRTRICTLTSKTSTPQVLHRLSQRSRRTGQCNLTATQGSRPFNFAAFPEKLLEFETIWVHGEEGREIRQRCIKHALWNHVFLVFLMDFLEIIKLPISLSRYKQIKYPLL